MNTTPASRLAALWRANPSPFLPTRTPQVELPPEFALLATLEARVPETLNGALPGAQSVIGEALHPLPADHFPDPSTLAEPDLDRLLTACSLLGHAWRWDRIPSPSRDFHIDSLGLPPALERVWRRAAKQRGIPMVGTLWTLLLANWHLEGCTGGAPYTTDDLQPDRLRILANFLPGQRGTEMERFVVTFIRSEGVGTELLTRLVPLMEAIEREDAPTAARLLEAVPALVKRLVTIFLEQIDPHHMDPNAWLDHIQRPYVWGVVDGETGERHEGPSGMQLGVMSVLNSLFDVRSRSSLAQSIRAAWSLLPPHQQAFLEACEACRPLLRQFVCQPGREGMQRSFNAALDQLSAWRRCHQSRGTRYFQGSGEGPTMEASTGLVVDGGSNLLTHFLKAMEERLVETHQSRLFRLGNALTKDEQALVAIIQAHLDDDNLLDPAERASIDAAAAQHSIPPERLQQLLSDRRLRSSFPRRDQQWLLQVHGAAAACSGTEPDWSQLRATGLRSGIAEERLDLLTVLVREALGLAPHPSDSL